MYARQLVGFSWCILLAAGSMVLAQSSDRPVNWKELPEPFHTKSSSNRPQVVLALKVQNSISPTASMAKSSPAVSSVLVSCSWVPPERFW